MRERWEESGDPFLRACWAVGRGRRAPVLQKQANPACLWSHGHTGTARAGGGVSEGRRTVGVSLRGKGGLPGGSGWGVTEAGWLLKGAEREVALLFCP